MVWNGDGIYKQIGPNINQFTLLTSGYPGDPAFIALSPDYQRAALGAGFSGDLTIVNADSPAIVQHSLNTSNNYWGAWISNTQLLINRSVYVGPGPFDYDLAELALVDISGTPTTKVVLDDIGMFSAAFAVDLNAGVVYAADGNTGETRSFDIADLVTAYNTDTPALWTAGQLIGTYNAGGPVAVNNDGNLVIGGFPSIQTVDPDDGSILDSYDPVGTGFEYYYAFYIPALDMIIALQSIFGGDPVAYAPNGTIIAFVPVMGFAGVSIAISAIALVGYRRRRS
jgi:hypothetical protein